MYRPVLLGCALMIAASTDSPFPLRTEAPPKDWKADEINKGLPYFWEPGTVHVLAWETTEDVRDGLRSQTTQVLVLKRFEKPTARGGYRWVLAHLYHHPEDKTQPWGREMLRLPPVRRGEELPKLTDAQVFGHDFYNDLPTNKQLGTFVREAGWAPELGPWEAVAYSDERVVTLKCFTTLKAGGVDCGLWKQVFDRDVPTDLFPELKKATGDKK